MKTQNILHVLRTTPSPTLDEKTFKEAYKNHRDWRKKEHKKFLENLEKLDSFPINGNERLESLKRICSEQEQHIIEARNQSAILYQALKK
ncbi:hypothetical protein [Emticicia soli]|uniref:Uncharacterized protein n=1 Tax=Emticicia soli TaxID=2027878 RepID=A0ABW5J8P7_9BACT